MPEDVWGEMTLYSDTVSELKTHEALVLKSTTPEEVEQDALIAEWLKGLAKDEAA